MLIIEIVNYIIVIIHCYMSIVYIEAIKIFKLIKLGVMTSAIYAYSQRLCILNS